MDALHARLQECDGQYDLETIQACRAELQEVCGAYLAVEGAGDGGPDDPFTGSGELARTALLVHLAQAESSINNLHHMDFESDLSAVGKRLLEEIGNVRTTSEKLEQLLSTAY